MMKDKILIFIITYRASYRVKNVVQKIPFRYFKNKNFKIYISDDDSRDETIDFIKQIQKKYKSKVIANFIKKNVGYGANIKKKTLFEMGDDEDIVSVQKEYIRLADLLWNGTEGLAPSTMEDRDIFELLGFD